MKIENNMSTLSKLNLLWRGRNGISGIVRKIKNDKLTYLSRWRMLKLAQVIEDMEVQGLNGDIIEAGCALGGSTIMMGLVKGQSRKLNVYDVFEQIPSPTENDSQDALERYKDIKNGTASGIGGDEYYGYQKNIEELVRKNISKYGLNLDSNNINLFKWLVQDTLVTHAPVALAHIDVDWYDPVKVCLDRIYPVMVSGGRFIIDDYSDWDGCERAVNEFLANKALRLEVHFGAAHLIRA